LAPKPKLSEAQIADLRARAAADKSLTQQQLADEYGVDPSTISRLISRMVEAPPATPPSAPSAGEIAMLSVADIVISSLNPRKTFDENAMAELVASIETSGLLQNLVVRPAENGFYQIVNGERRFRAILYLSQNGRWNQKFPCRVISASDGEHIALALLENIIRENVPPIEEAEAFKQLQALDAVTWSTANIAAKIGKTPRFVQQRLSLVNKLAPAARDALASGRLSLDAARLMTTAAPKIQEDMLKRRKADHTIKAQDIQWEISGTLFQADYAIFDTRAADLETIEVDGIVYFEDRTAAVELQTAAIKAKADELRKSWSFVKTLKVGEYFNEYLWQTKIPQKKGGGCVISISRGYEVEIHTGLLKKPEPSKKASAAPERDYAAEQAKRAENERKAQQKRRDTLLAVTRRLDSDRPFDTTVRAYDDEDNAPEPLTYEDDCAAGCRHRLLLGHPNAYVGFFVCGNPKSPRAGLLTFYHQGGGDCFEKGK
jgi:ParB/RepB/Spo0J family partition protein